MSKNMITVKGKGDLGYSQKFGEIIAGQEYSIEPEDFAPELFERPSPGWLAPWEQPAEQPANDGKKGGKK